MKNYNFKKSGQINNSLIKNIFENEIAPLYGSQTSAINKILDGKDRACEILFDGDDPAGFIVYKLDLQNEYGLQDAFELKTAILFKQYRNNTQIGKILFQHAENLAVQHKAKAIYGTVSSGYTSFTRYLKINKWGVLSQQKSGDNKKDVFVLAKNL